MVLAVLGAVPGHRPLIWVPGVSTRPLLTLHIQSCTHLTSRLGLELTVERWRVEGGGCRIRDWRFVHRFFLGATESLAEAVVVTFFFGSDVFFW